MLTESESAVAIAERLQNEADQVLRAAESILWEADGAGSFTPAQMIILRTAGLTEHREIERELGRINSVRGHMAEAGSNSQFTAAEQRLAAATEQVKLLKPELEEQIRAAQQKLSELEAELRAATRAEERMRQAREILRHERLLPKFARDQLAMNVRNCTKNLRSEIARIDDRLTVINSVLELDPKEAVPYARRVDEENRGNPGHHPLCDKQEKLCVGGSSMVTYSVPPGSLQAHKRELLMERPGLEQQRERALAELQRLRDSFSGCRDYYLDQLPE